MMKGSRFDFIEEFLPLYKAKGATLAEQYFDIGKLFASPIKKSFEMIVKQKSKMAERRMVVAQNALQHLRVLSQNKRYRYQLLVGEYLNCLEAWARGAGLAGADEAILLIADNHTECQTAIVRLKNSILLLHTEENFENITKRMSIVHTVEFDDHGNKYTSLVYNDLLPGSAMFGWSEGHAVAVDSLYLKDMANESVVDVALANVAAWMIWKMKDNEVSAENVQEFVQSLGSYADGYAINVIYGAGEGYKIIFAGRESEVEKLQLVPGKYLRQVNIVEPKKRSSMAFWKLSKRKMPEGIEELLEERLRKLDKLAEEYRPSMKREIEPENIPKILEAIQDGIYEKSRKEGYDLVNEDVGATVVSVIMDGKVSVLVRINEDEKGKDLV